MLNSFNEHLDRDLEGHLFLVKIELAAGKRRIAAYHLSLISYEEACAWLATHSKNNPAKFLAFHGIYPPIKQVPYSQPGQVEREPQWWYDTDGLIYGEETLLEILCGPLAVKLQRIATRAHLRPEDVLLIAMRSKLLESGVSVGNWLLDLAANIARTATETRESYGIPAGAARAGSKGGAQ